MYAFVRLLRLDSAHSVHTGYVFFGTLVEECMYSPPHSGVFGRGEEHDRQQYNGGSEEAEGKRRLGLGAGQGKGQYLYLSLCLSSICIIILYT